MLIKLYYSLVIVAAIASIPVQSGQTVTHDTKEKVVSLELIVPAAIPIRIYDPKLEMLPGELKYGIKNQTKEKILRIDGFLYLLSSAGEIKMTAEWTEVDIKPRETRNSEYNYLFLSEEQSKPLEEMSPQDCMILAILEVKTASGSWVIDENELKAAAKSKAAGKRFRMPQVEREPALRIGEKDKAELFRITIEHLFRVTELLEYLGIRDTKNIILSTQDIGMYVIPIVPGVNIIQMEPKEIQQRANREGRIIFMSYSPPEVRGSRVFVGFNSTDRVRQGAMAECWGGDFTFEYRRKSGKWEYLRGAGGRF